MIKSLSLSLAILALLSFAPLAKAESEPVKTVPYVDINRYMGTWYEIGALPQSFQKNCYASSAQYTLRDDGKVDVLNSCHLGSAEGELKEAKGVAYVADTETNAKLKVSFFWPFYGDYWIIDLGANYEYAVVGNPDRDAFWILSREPKMSKELVNEIKARAEAQGFDLSEFKITGTVN